MELEIRLSQEDIQRIKDNQEDILLHPDSIERNQDVSCPKIFWNEFGYGSGIGEWTCLLNPYTYGDIFCSHDIENTDYLPCDCKNFNNCSRIR